MTRKPDVIIVGAGINGLSATLELVRQGLSVRVIDPCGPENPAGASWGNHRLIHPFSDRPDRPTADDAITALHAWKEVLEHIGCDGFAPVGVLSQCPGPLARRAAGITHVETQPAEAIVERYPIWRGLRGEVTLAVDFGVLMASEILTSLRSHLEATGQVSFVTETASHLAPDQPVVLTDQNRHEARLCVVIAAGAGTGRLLAASGQDLEPLAGHFRRFECHVLHADHPELSLTSDQAAFYSMAGQDLWGMQPVRGQRLKLGFGKLSKEQDPNARTGADTIAKAMMRAYTSQWPGFGQCHDVEVESSHWTSISLPFPLLRKGPHVIVTADNGGGFKFAPLTGKSVARTVLR
ncbi:FAD-dependent oxidoreductase [Puniceibacterium sediminis]|uniref:Glycine/D-amino acid oxidase n=1 Tax=Puniceibacterium sediminis TaxID=1608407 RepID=A0A238YV47_9RHOB|nr:FAD-dependent oxidoreductase [Puniceibacterium sediminis]SNR74678.1 Glycine/D-amino acid oxidase [Puniceibacterium sediminis]